jgi:AraC family transcriptional regulator of arabinose operon
VRELTKLPWAWIILLFIILELKQHYMSETSNWPLSSGAVRTLVPASILNELDNDALCQDLYPTALGYYPTAHRHAMRRHRHDDYLLLYCRDGEGIVTVGGDTKRQTSGTSPSPEITMRVSAGDIVVLEKGCRHHYSAKESNPWSLYWFHFSGHAAQRCCKYLLKGANEPIIRGLNDMALQSHFRSLVSTITMGHSLPVFVHASSQIKVIFSCINLLRQRGSRAEADDSMTNVTQFLRENVHKNLSLEALAELRGLSKYHFNRQYKLMNGYAPMQHFTHMKIEQACLLLEGSNMSVAEVGFQLGYEDPLYFSRVFRKVVGVSPSGYRSQSK